ncbi:uncharacterized protein LOC144586020 isoform X1 [Pogona vitticeps]
METAPLLQKFLRVQPRAFGAVLVVLGLVQSALGGLFLVFHCSYTDYLGIHFFSGISLFLAGIVAIIVDQVPRIGLVKTCLIFHIAAAAVAVVINFLYVRDILYYISIFCTFTDQVQSGCKVAERVMFYCRALRGIAFATGAVGVCLTVCLAAFICRTICYHSSDDTAPVIGLHLQDGKRDTE